MKINKNIKDYFENQSIDIDSLFFEKDKIEEILDKLNSDDSKIMISKIDNIQNVNNAHKILFATSLLELRSQVKKNQEQISEIQKKIEYESKCIQKTLKSIEEKLNSL